MVILAKHKLSGEIIASTGNVPQVYAALVTLAEFVSVAQDISLDAALVLIGESTEANPIDFPDYVFWLEDRAPLTVQES